MNEIDRVILVTVDCLRWDYHKPYKEIYPSGKWYRGSAQATMTPSSHYSLFTSKFAPRHGVLNMESRYGAKSVLTESDAVSLSVLHGQDTSMVTDPNAPMSEYGEFYFTQLLDSLEDGDEIPNDDWKAANPNYRWLEEIDSHDFSFVHDWILHASGGAHSGDDWTKTISIEQSHEENVEAYEYTLEKSVEAHRRFVDVLKENNLYENTLFIVWGDHGQSLLELGEGDVGHGNCPVEYQARIPIAFCSTAFGESETDLYTNARSIDVLPTLEWLIRDSGLDISYDKEYIEGINLLAFEGSLVSYTLSVQTHSTGIYDGVLTADHSLIEIGEKNVYSCDVSESNLEMNRSGDSEKRDELIEWYDTLRSSRDRGIAYRDRKT